MVLTLERAIAIVRHAGYGDTSIEPKNIVDEAANRLLQMHPWNVTCGPARHLGVRAEISFDNATWTTATRTLTLAAAFTNYTHAPGDMVSITAGTAANVRDYEVQEKTSANAIILTEDIGSANGAADIDGTLRINRAAILPSDFGSRLKTYSATEGLNQALTLTTQQQLEQMRSTSTIQPIGHYWGALWQAHNKSVAGGEPAWRLELWPYPTSVDPMLFKVSYRQAWSRPSVDAATLPIPAILESLFLAVLRAVTRGYEEEEEGTIEDRIDRIRMSSVFQDATLNDGLSQPNAGPMIGGNEELTSQGWELFPTEFTADPA